MLWNRVLSEAVVTKKDDKYRGLFIYFNGRKYHVSEKMEIHFLNFSMKDQKYIARYIKRTTQYKPKKNNKSLDKVPADKKRESSVNYEQYSAPPLQLTFESFSELYNYSRKIYNENPWLSKLIDKIIIKNKNELNKRSGSSKFLDDIKDISKRFENAVKYDFKINKLHPQYGIIIREYFEEQPKVKWILNRNTKAKIENEINHS